MLQDISKVLGQFGLAQRSARAPVPAAFARPSIEDRLVALFRRLA
ncbi:hypothetical protein [Pelagibius litoralis]|nr:hypothetical protein [Pelagibius litoralis]